MICLVDEMNTSIKKYMRIDFFYFLGIMTSVDVTLVR
jgi:hypothetical protein